MGLLAGKNDEENIKKTGDGREINRLNFSVEEIEQALQKEVVQRLLKLIRFRNEYPAFNGDFTILDTDEHTLSLCWEKDEKRCQLSVDLDTYRTVIKYTDDTGRNVDYNV